jgi:hypothetical protein
MTMPRNMLDGKSSYSSCFSYSIPDVEMKLIEIFHSLLQNLQRYCNHHFADLIHLKKE